MMTVDIYMRTLPLALNTVFRFACKEYITEEKTRGRVSIA